MKDPRGQGESWMRVAVVLHERIGGWYRQLRPRLSEQPIRWFESRSTADLEEILDGLAFPIILIDLARQPLDGLTALELVRTRTPGAWTLVLDPEGPAVVGALAVELGATHVRPGFTPPPLVADLIGRWTTIARARVETAGWSRTTFPESAAEPWGWLSRYLVEPAGPSDTPSAAPRTIDPPTTRRPDAHCPRPTGDND